MKCHVCGSNMKNSVTDLPFKTYESSIVILKGLPLFQCEGCTEYLLDDLVMQKVDKFLGKVDKLAELEVIKYAA